jgi:SAM-dependent methyltransferase
MDEQYELQTHQLEDHHWWYRGRRRVVDEVIRSLGLPPGARILDAGCGSGRNMVELAPYGNVTGVDVSPASVDVAKARDVGEAMVASLSEPLPFPDASFDLAVSLDVLEHIDDDRSVLRELRRVIRPGGRLLVTVPAYPWLWSSHDEVNHHRRRYTRRALLTVAAEAGWTPLRSTHFTSLLLPAAIVHRAMDRVRNSSGPPGSDLERTPEWLNEVLERPMGLEARLVRWGVPIPAGLSLLVVFG